MLLQSEKSIAYCSIFDKISLCIGGWNDFTTLGNENSAGKHDRRPFGG